MWTPEDIIQAVIKYEDDETDAEKIIREVLARMETQAREILSEAGYAPHEWYLEGEDEKGARREWGKEAEYLLEGGEAFETEQAAIVLIGIDDIGWHLDSGRTSDAVLSMMKIIACGLLPNDSKRSELIQKMIPFACQGKKLSATNSAKGRKGAKARWGGDENEALKQIVEKLAAKRDALGDPLRPSDLWPLLYSALENFSLCPIEHNGDKLLSAAIHFGDDGEITYEAFRRRIKRERSAY